MQLPIDSRLAEIVGHTERNTVTLLQAEPGAGKTTRVPPALLRAGFSNVYVLEPRRLAARMAARRVAEELNEPLGRTVGYQVRFEKVGDASTALWFLTEGVFTNRLLSGPALPQRSVVVLDEFHERHLETDLSLALLRKLLETRPDLRVLIMSATLSTDISSQLPGSPFIQVSGRTYPVEVRYTPASATPLEHQVASAAATALQSTEGHVLAFLPGAAEIRAAMQACQPLANKSGVRVLPLYGDLNPAEQDLAVAPSSTRKIICATNVAESSVTVEGVTTVVDSGLARMATHSTWTGFSRLQIGRISRASAIQRAGRAGRTGPGIAIRLFPHEDFVRRPEATPPEVIRADWAETLLRLAAAGYEPSDLPWLDAPPAASLEAARDLLTRLYALDSKGQITSFGRQMARLSVHPRMSCLALKGAEFGAAGESAHLAAWLADESARLDRRNGHRYSSDLEAILAADLSYSARRTQASLREGTRSIRNSVSVPHALEKAVLAAYPDRVGSRRGEMLLLSNGASARLDPSSVAVGTAFLVALEVEDRAELGTPVVRVASEVEPDWLLDLFPERLEASDELRWNRSAERVEQASVLRYDRLVIDETVSTHVNSAATDLLVAKALEAGLSNFTDADAVNRLFARVRFAAAHGARMKPEEELLKDALGEIAAGLISFAELKQAAGTGMLPALEAQLDMRHLDEVAPTHVRLPSGRRAPIEYIDGQPPAASSRLQDFFGMKQTPTVARGAVPLTVKLLAPNGRPVQITTDLVSFWKDLYPQVRRELSRRYPRHSWPESPA